jgi:GlpG protein
MMEDLTKYAVEISNYFSYNSVVILSYFFICLIMLILNAISKNKINNFLVIRRGSIFNPMNYVRLVLSGLCHSDWSHFRNNFLTILLIGPMLEEKYGSVHILQMIIMTSIISSLIYLILHNNSGAIGTSDNVFMMIVLCSVVNITSGKIPITLVLIFIFYIADEIIKQISGKKDNVSHDSHIVGAICGFIYGYFIF